ncbi:PQQ-dependent sugar dehydrogenase, partial [Pseudomonas syringae]
MLRKTLIATLCTAAILSLPLTAGAATENYKSELGTVTVSQVAGGLNHPWAVAFLPDRQGMLVTERSGNLRLVTADGKLSAPLSGVPEVWAQKQGGLLDVVLSPDFAKDRMVYLTYSEGNGKTAAEGDKAGTAAGRGRLSADMTKLEGFEKIFTQEPKLSVGNHFGARLVFDRDGYLFITLGENNNRPTAQD